MEKGGEEFQSLKTQKDIFKFKQFEIDQTRCSMKVGTDGVLLGSWANVENTESIIDIGTGTGVIAIMLAQRAEKAKIDAIDVDEISFKQASENMKNSPWANRLQAIHISIQEYAKLTDKNFDLIVSNPPFFTGGTLSDQINRNKVRHTIKLPSGDLLSAVRKLLKKEGKFCVILPLIEGLRFKELAQNYNLFCTKMMEVRPKYDKNVERLLLQFERQPKPMVTEKLIIQYEERNNYTEDYILLTKDFYLNM